MARPTGYSRQQILLHWLTVAAVAAQFAFHDPIADAFDDGLDTGVFSISPGVLLHIGLGLVILTLTALRLLARKDRGVPPPPDAEPDALKMVSKAAHLAFYGLLIALPITGVLAWGGQSEFMGEVHEVLRALLLLLIVAHVGAVIVHQFIWKTGLITRMLRAER